MGRKIGILSHTGAEYKPAPSKKSPFRFEPGAPYQYTRITIGNPFIILV
jgi:hypothetical protein